MKQFDRGLEITLKRHAKAEVAKVWQVRHNLDLDLDKNGEILKVTIWVFEP